MDFGQATAEDVWKRGYDRLLERRHVHAAKRETSLKARDRAKAEWLRAEEQLRADEIHVKVADEMLQVYADTFNPPDDVPSLLGLGRFAGTKLKDALATLFKENPTRWFTVPELEEKLSTEGFDGEITHMNAAIHAACKRFKGSVKTQEGIEGRQYRHADLLERMDDAIQELEGMGIASKQDVEPVANQRGEFEEGGE